MAERHIKPEETSQRRGITSSSARCLPHPHSTTLSSLHTAMDWQSLQEGLKKEAPPKDVKNDKDTAENTVVSPDMPQHLHLCDLHYPTLGSVDVEQPSVMEDVLNTAINSFKKDSLKEVNNDTTRLPRRDFFSKVYPGDCKQYIERKYTKEHFAALRSKKPDISSRKGRNGFDTPSTSMSSKTPAGSDEKNTSQPFLQKNDDEVIAVDMATGIITTHNPKMLPFEGEADWVLVSSSESEDDADTVGDWEMV